MSQKLVIGPEALILNPALKDLGFLIGNWSTTGTHPQASTKTLRGRTSFSWHEGGAFMIMHSEIDEPEFPSGVAMIGSDDTKGKLAMLYFDERGTSRVFEVTVEREESLGAVTIQISLSRMSLRRNRVGTS